MRILFLYLFILFNTNYICFSQSTNEIYRQETDTNIIWTNDRKLVWQDFKSKEKRKNIGVAQTAANIEIKPFLNKFGKYDYKVLSVFYKDKSWTGTKNLDVLAHEQTHFDIAELFARKMRKEISLVNSNNKNVKEADYRRIHKRFFRQYLAFQNKYDLETKYSKNTKLQSEWNKDIAIELKLLKDYELKI